MTRVKHGFGVFIALFALYYGHLSYSLFQPFSVAARQREPGIQSANAGSETDELNAAFRQARADGKPVVIDFWASWCKNCSAMEQTTFRNENVRSRLGTFHAVKYQAERPNQAPAKEVLDHFGAIGLPTYVVLAPPPKSSDENVSIPKTGDP